jgi:hypothetical protein
MLAAVHIVLLQVRHFGYFHSHEAMLLRQLGAGICFGQATSNFRQQVLARSLRDGKHPPTSCQRAQQYQLSVCTPSLLAMPRTVSFM